METER